ncbi:MAG: hypothetical protein M3076_10905, partial [Actinomycetota bacterium]|nr:hypothetical protein [Actinomycetota bacterium]
MSSSNPNHTRNCASLRRCPIRTATILVAIALGSGGLLVGGCGGSASGSLTRSQAQASPTQQQAGAAAQHSGSSPSVAGSTSHHKTGVHAHRSSTAKARSSQAHGTTTGQGVQHTSGSTGGTVAALVPKGPNPCVFVSAAAAQAIIGTPIAGTTEAPLGPTCVFKLKGQRQTITIAVETQRIGTQVRYMHRRRHLVL